MWQRLTKKCRQSTNEKQEEEEENQIPNHHFFECAELILSWLSPPDLATISLTCKTLALISKSITIQRSIDASRSFENHPIPFFNTVDGKPYAYFIYTPSQIISSSSQCPVRQSWGSQIDAKFNSPSRFVSESVGLVGDETGEGVTGCDCERCDKDGDDGFGCPCLDLEGLGILSECGPSCGCGLECGNRFAQRGVSVRLKIVRNARKGWGLYADQLIREGQFVCEYAGELLTTKEARRRQQIYDELALGGQFSSALLVVREHLPSGNACLRINIDATRVGNIARFINHSCDGGNLSTAIARSSGALLPRLCFIASRDIKEDEELTFSYGEIRVRPKGLQCFCDSSCCFGILPAEYT